MRIKEERVLPHVHCQKCGGVINNSEFIISEKFCKACIFSAGIKALEKKK